MVIVGYGGLGIELLGLMLNDNFKEEILFFDENEDVPKMAYGKYRITSDLDTVKEFFKSDTGFVVGIGHPRLRKKMTELMGNLGGQAVKYISSTASISPFAEGCLALVAQPGTGISHHTTIGMSCSLHINSVIGHHVELGEYATVSPNVTIIGPTVIGGFCQIGSNSVILPNTKIGNNVIIPAGSIVDGIVHDNETFSS